MAFNPARLCRRRRRQIFPPTAVKVRDDDALRGDHRDWRQTGSLARPTLVVPSSGATPGEIFMQARDSENLVRARVKHKCHTLEMKQKLFRFAALSTIYIRY